MKKDKKKATIVFLASLFIYPAFMAYLFAVPTQFQEIKKLEAAEKVKAPLILRPPVEYKAEGLRDPFRGYERGDEAGGSATKGPVKPLPSLTIQGIVWGGNLAQAVINNKVLKVGDTIEGVRVIDINKEGVTVFFDGQQYNLSSPAAGSLLPKTEPEPEEKGGN